MKKILCFGDSNTYGHLPADGSRMACPWPVVLRRLVGNDVEIIEEGQCGRTTAYSLPENPSQSGLYRFSQITESGECADALILMLGTNDLLSDFDRTAAESAQMLRKYIHMWRNAFGTDGKILIVSPILIRSEFLKHPYFSTVYPAHAAEKSSEFADGYRKLCAEENCDFLNAADICRASSTDGIHMEPEEHKKLAEAVFAKLIEMGVLSA